jgi:hypothetical protein
MRVFYLMALFEVSKFSDVDIPRALLVEANSGIDKLRARLVDTIDQSCPIPNVVVRSQVQAFFQGQIRRGLMFNGYDACLAGRGLVAYTCARAIYETFACVMDFCDKLTDHIAEGDFEKTGAFIHARQFAARMKDFASKEVIVKEIIDNTAINILTQIDRVSKHFPGFREDYDYLSEMTHPNGGGAMNYFWESGDGIMKFSNAVDQERVMRSLVKAGYLLARMEHGTTFVETKLANLPWH